MNNYKITESRYILVSYMIKSSKCYKIIGAEEQFIVDDSIYGIIDGELTRYEVVLSSDEEDDLKNHLYYLQHVKDEDRESISHEITLISSLDPNPTLDTCEDFVESQESFSETTSSVFEYPRLENEDGVGNNVCVLGVKGTKILEYYLSTIDWNDYRSATIDLLNAVFGEETLATHTLTSRRPKKPQLDMDKVEDIITVVSSRCGAKKFEVYQEISMRCNRLHMFYDNCLSKISSFLEF